MDEIERALCIGMASVLFSLMTVIVPIWWRHRRSAE